MDHSQFHDPNEINDHSQGYLIAAVLKDGKRIYLARKGEHMPEFYQYVWDENRQNALPISGIKSAWRAADHCRYPYGPEGKNYLKVPDEASEIHIVIDLKHSFTDADDDDAE